MKAIRVEEFGAPEVLAYKEALRPEATPGEILVEVEAAGVNFIDVYHRTGAYQTGLPLTPGVEGAGEVAAVGMDVSQFERGDRVAYAMVMGIVRGIRDGPRRKGRSGARWVRSASSSGRDAPGHDGSLSEP